MFDRANLKQAFEFLGRELTRDGIMVEIAVYGACAAILQFDWRRTTEDVDAVVRQGYDEAALKRAVEAVAVRMALAPDWLNNAVGMFTPLEEDDALFAVSGVYPAGDKPGLRVLIATPRYLLAMKLLALSNLDRGDKDLDDARILATNLGIVDIHDLHLLYSSIHGEAPPGAVARMFPLVLRAS